MAYLIPVKSFKIGVERLSGDFPHILFRADLWQAECVLLEGGGVDLLH